MPHTKKAAPHTKNTFQPHPCPSCHPRYHQCLTDIDRTSPVHPQLRYPPRCLPLNRMLSSSNRPKNFTSSANLCEQHAIILKAMSSRCNVLSVLHSIFFLTKCSIFFSLCYLSCIPCTFSSFNISLMTSVTEVTRVRFCKV